jgi:lipocalin
MRPDGKVNVLNAGYKDGKKSTATGKAKFAGASNIGHLKVSFFWIFYSDYIIIELDSEYNYALVAGGSHKLLWILARTPTLDKKIVDSLVGRAQALGFDTSKLYFVPQQ